MIKFNYKARDARGQTSNGTLTVLSREDAVKAIRAEGKYLLDLQEAGGGAVAAPVSLTQQGKAVKRDDVIHFTHQMAVMLQTGVPLSEALETVNEQATHEAFKAVLSDVCSSVQAGGAFSAALMRHPKVFPNLMTSLIRASEASGTMGQMLERISVYLSKERQMVKKVRGALAYPLFMLFMAVGVTIFLMTFVMPRFAKIYEGKGAALPLPTQMLIGVSDALINYWYLWIGCVAVAIGGFLWFRTTPLGRQCLDRLKINVPIIGSLFRQLYICRAMQTMGTMVNAGVPMLDMISITRGVTVNTQYQKLWDQVDEKLRHGAQLSVPLTESTLIPRSIARMISSGEKSGRLGQVMQRIAEVSETDFDEAVGTATQFIEPLMITVMGLIIGGVAISLLLPIFSIGRVISGAH